MTKQELEAAAKELSRLHREMNTAIVAAEQYAQVIYKKITNHNISTQIDALMSETKREIAHALYKSVVSEAGQ